MRETLKTCLVVSLTVGVAVLVFVLLPAPWVAG